ncbi:hypothetical protein [Bradyrhizobium sp. 23]|uniref:SGNH/GDSL hydrolase family protein n=1 Tax=Bradyrhizobium sp. 23 TaxID=2782667 RepID=UPI001FFAAFF0|nr:hypothetical protein [Bradyrhizobium sp. 23]MCK1313365.1 hypothetical protein [Bradyrhizobium sp. 23]
MRWVWVVIALIVSNLATGYFVNKNSIPKIDPYRDMNEAMTAMSQSSRYVVILGDSVTKRARWPKQVCGYSLINMGIAGARASTFIQYSQEMKLRGLKPSLTVVALGTNDALQMKGIDFDSSFELLLRNLHQPLSLVTAFQPAVAEVNKKIRTWADREEALVIETEGLPIPTDDGIHPAKATFNSWTDVVLAGIRKGLACP